MKEWISKHKKAIVLSLAALIVLAAAAGTCVLLTVPSKEEESVYKETTVAYGPLTVGITEDGTVSVGTVEQSFALDISEYSSGTDMGADMRGPMGMRLGSTDSGGSRKLEVEEVYVSPGQQVKKGDPLFKLTVESVDDIREELVSDEEDARLSYESLALQQEKAEREAAQTYEQNQVYGKAAPLEYEESLHELQKAAEDAQEALEDAQEDLEEYRSRLEEVQTDYEEAKRYLEEAEAAVAEENETYWYLKNEESREQAEKTVQEEEDEMESLEDQIFDKEQEIVSLLAGCNEAVKAYQTGEADAKTQYDKRTYYLAQAAEIYSIATDGSEYQARVAKEDYEAASEKLRAFDSYITDGVVSAEYEGVITEVGIEAGDTVQNDTTIASLNHYDDITVSTDVDDDDIRSVSVGDKVNLFFSAFPEGEFSGVVSNIGDASTDSNSNITYAVEIAVSGDVAGLYEGMSGEVTFITKETKEVLSVSNRAIIREGTKSYVKMRDAEGNIQTKEVVTGFSDGSSVEIKEGLEEGDVVLIESRVKG